LPSYCTPLTLLRGRGHSGQRGLRPPRGGQVCLRHCSRSESAGMWCFMRAAARGSAQPADRDARGAQAGAGACVPAGGQPSGRKHETTADECAAGHRHRSSSRRDSRSHEATRVIRRKTNRRHMIGDHHGRTAGSATLLVRAMDGILGTHRFGGGPGTFQRSGCGPPARQGFSVPCCRRAFEVPPPESANLSRRSVAARYGAGNSGARFNDGSPGWPSLQLARLALYGARVTVDAGQLWQTVPEGGRVSLIR